MTILPPTIVFVPGAWHGPEFFGPVISILEPLGYKCVTVSMPAVGRTKPVDSLDEDIAVVRTAVMKELDAGLDVIMHAHSWAGIPVNSALDGLSKPERERDGKKGAVVKLTFVSSFVIPENTSLLECIGGVVPDFWDILEVNGDFSVVLSCINFCRTETSGYRTWRPNCIMILSPKNNNTGCLDSDLILSRKVS